MGDNPEIVSRVREDSRVRGIPIINDSQEVEADGTQIGTWGIKQSYLQNTPAANFPPMNYKQYKNLLVFDDIVKGIVESEEEADEVPTVISGNGPRPPKSHTREESTTTPKMDDVSIPVMAATAATTAAATAAAPLASAAMNQTSSML